MEKNKIQSLFFTTLGLLMLASPALAGTALDMAKTIPIQHNGRVKAFDSFSRQTVEIITGKERWQRQDAVTTLLKAIAKKDQIADIPWVQVGPALRAHLKLDPPDKRFFSYNDLFPFVEKIRSLIESAREKHEADQGTSPVEKEAESLYARLVTVKDLMTGDSLRVLPPADDTTDAWRSPYDGADESGAEFINLAQLFSQNKPQEFKSLAAAWINRIHHATSDVYRLTIQLEVFYSSLRPFQLAWVGYLAAFLFLSAFKKIRAAKAAGLTLAAAAFIFHTLGLILRVVILKRPPVSNMYESMIYMNWAAMLFAAIFTLSSRNTVYLMAGSAVSALVMIYGNLLPIDSNLEVLVPVLRSNYWLTVHVMTIVSSYGAFGLAMAMGHRHLLLEFSGKFSKTAQETSAQLLYRVIQLGVLLLGMGTVLGGVWANESWGRFWGWDPKETWALITFLAYLVIVHLKYSKKINAHWLAISSVVGFFFVLMTWYGVNFVLGRGLHSYGFGSGGMRWILYYLGAELLFLAFTLNKRPIFK